LARLLKKYEGTRLGRQELQGELVEDADGALWTRALIEAWRVEASAVPALQRIVVAVDPSASSRPGGALCGIVVCGISEDGIGYVLSDLSGQMTPDEWARKASAAYHAFSADRIIYEVNHGGAMVESVFRTVDPDLPIKGVSASKGKWTRAEPVVALYEQGKVHHVIGYRPEGAGEDMCRSLADLEDQMCGWTPESRVSPDRMDAMVYAVTELMLSNSGCVLV
jgi:phage terminase large subunit-like protein